MSYYKGVIDWVIPREQQSVIIRRLSEEFEQKVKDAVLGRVTTNTPKYKAEAINNIYIHPRDTCKLVSAIDELMVKIVDQNYDVCKKYKKRKYK